MNYEMVELNILNTILTRAIYNVNLCNLHKIIDLNKLANIQIKKNNDKYIVEVKDMTNKKLYVVIDEECKYSKVFEDSLEGKVLYESITKNEQKIDKNVPNLLDMQTFSNLLNEKNENNTTKEVKNEDKVINDLLKNLDLNNREDAIERIDAAINALSNGQNINSNVQVSSHDKNVSDKVNTLKNKVEKLLLEWINYLRESNDEKWVNYSRIYRTKLEHILFYLAKDYKDDVSIKMYNNLSMIDELLKEKNKEELYKFVQDLIALESK